MSFMGPSKWSVVPKGIGRLFKRPVVRAIVGVYGALWVLTMTLGNLQTSEAFDEEFRYGFEGLTGERFEIPRIKSFYVEDLMTPRIES